jgi:hypothetical protein
LFRDPLDNRGLNRFKNAVQARWLKRIIVRNLDEYDKLALIVVTL